MEEKVILDILTERKTAPVPSESGGKMEELDFTKYVATFTDWIFIFFLSWHYYGLEQNFRFPILICLTAVVDYHEVHWSWWGGWLPDDDNEDDNGDGDDDDDDDGGEWNWVRKAAGAW